MRRILIGQVSLIICCTLYILWWYIGYRPGTTVDRIGGLNGMLLLMTAAFGLAGVIMSTGTVPELYPAKIDPLYLIPAGVLMYAMLLLITRTVFHRVVTTELILIVLWAVLEIAVINKLNAGGFLSDKLFFFFMAIVIIAVFILDIVLYVAYYRMEEMRAFYAAMVPLIAAAVTSGMLVILVMNGNRS